MNLKEHLKFKCEKLESIDLKTGENYIKTDEIGEEQENSFVADRVDIKNSDNYLFVTYARNVIIKKQYTIKIQYKITWEKIGEKESLKKILQDSGHSNENIDFLVNTAISEASMMISLITRSLNIEPLILPPIFNPLERIKT